MTARSACFSGPTCLWSLRRCSLTPVTTSGLCSITIVATRALSSVPISFWHRNAEQALEISGLALNPVAGHDTAAVHGCNGRGQEGAGWPAASYPAQGLAGELCGHWRLLSVGTSGNFECFLPLRLRLHCAIHSRNYKPRNKCQQETKATLAQRAIRCMPGILQIPTPAKKAATSSCWMPRHDDFVLVNSCHQGWWLVVTAVSAAPMPLPACD